MTARRVLGFVVFVIVALLLFAGGWLVGRLGIGSVVDPTGAAQP